VNDARPGIRLFCLVCGLMLALMSTPPVLSQVPKPSATKTAKVAPKPLSEATRKQIYWEGFAIEHKAERAAKARYPDKIIVEGVKNNWPRPPSQP
jgi:hypothetical protein